MAGKEFQWIDFNNDKVVKTAEDLSDYFQHRKAKDKKYGDNRAFYHQYFFHYSNLNSINKIFATRSFLCCEYGGSNDPMEKETNPHRVFALCFGTGISKNIPLWFLYAGTGGDGGCLKLKPACFYDFYKNASYTLAIKKKEADDYQDKDKVYEGEDFILKVQDVLYAVEEGSVYRLKYNTMQRTFDAAEFKAFQKENRHFIKSIPWYYEKETRILITLTEKGYAKVGELENPDDKVAVRMSFYPNMEEGMHLLLGPNISTDEKLTPLEGAALRGKIKTFPEIEAFDKKYSHLERSALAGQVTINLSEAKGRGEGPETQRD